MQDSLTLAYDETFENGNFCLLSKRQNAAIKFYGLVKSQKMYFIPMKAVIPYFQ